MSDIDKIVVTKVSPFNGYPGEFILMINGELWFHPYSSKSKPSKQRSSLARNALDQLACESLDRAHLITYSELVDPLLGDCDAWNQKRINHLLERSVDWRLLSYEVKQINGEYVS